MFFTHIQYFSVQYIFSLLYNIGEGGVGQQKTSSVQISHDIKVLVEKRFREYL